MKKVNLLSKAELKKIKGGDPEPGGICSAAVYCMSPANTVVYKIPVPDCDNANVFGLCYQWDYEHNEGLIAMDLSYCDVC